MRSHLEASFPLRCFQRLSFPNIATRQCHWRVCGLGNFSLPLARRVARVVGVEGVAAMVERAGANASDCLGVIWSSLTGN
ncbi:hypothetical protein IPC612_03825 [Pseudomonas aeruginosa]|nr:hypothetical protein IPC612_03825 [Pseudomonas aeruginosa]